MRVRGGVIRVLGDGDLYTMFIVVALWLRRGGKCDWVAPTERQ